jgi:hypothetical protein
MATTDGPADAATRSKFRPVRVLEIVLERRRFLLASREFDADREKSRLPLVSRLVFETESAVLKSMISKS